MVPSRTAGHSAKGSARDLIVSGPFFLGAALRAVLLEEVAALEAEGTVKAPARGARRRAEARAVFIFACLFGLNNEMFETTFDGWPHKWMVESESRANPMGRFAGQE